MLAVYRCTNINNYQIEKLKSIKQCNLLFFSLTVPPIPSQLSPGKPLPPYGQWVSWNDSPNTDNFKPIATSTQINM